MPAMMNEKHVSTTWLRWLLDHYQSHIEDWNLEGDPFALIGRLREEIDDIENGDNPEGKDWFEVDGACPPIDQKTLDKI